MVPSLTQVGQNPGGVKTELGLPVLLTDPCSADRQKDLAENASMVC